MVAQEHDDDVAEQVRVIFTLDPSQDSELEVPSEAIAIPSNLRRKGLSAVINHLLDRKLEDDEEDGDDDDEDKLPAIVFDFIINGKLLRTGVETAARRYGLSLEESIVITYFPAQEAPEHSSETDPVPDWISNICMSGTKLVTAGYDGTIRFFEANGKEDGLEPLSSVSAHSGPIKCLAVSDKFLATGSLDQTLVVHKWSGSKSAELYAYCKEGHTSSIGCVDFNKSNQLLSGDWDGNISLWDLNAAVTGEEGASQIPESTKKRKTTSKSSTTTASTIKPVSSFEAHTSQVSGMAWMPDGAHVVTGSWDHSVKVWNVEQQDCLLALNGSRVVSCLDLSPKSEGVVATGHADCTIRLWDIRTEESSSSLVSDSSLKPSHKAWVSAVQWSPTDPYILASASHDGTLKVWDIRSSLPLHTIRTHGKEEKSLCLAYGEGAIYTGGTDCIVKQYSC